VWDMLHPTVGPVSQLGFPLRVSGDGATPRRFAPVLGEHTRQVLGAVGYTVSEILDLERAGIVRSARRAGSEGTEVGPGRRRDATGGEGPTTPSDATSA
jgi:hypothetical protein